MKAYLAAMYSKRDELRAYKILLEKVGIEVTSRWLTEKAPLKSNMGDHSTKFYKRTAKIDIEDIDKADILIFFSEDPLVGTKRGGRHVEFGYALANGLPIYVIGVRENVFHYMKTVTHFDTLEQFINVIENK